MIITDRNALRFKTIAASLLDGAWHEGTEANPARILINAAMELNSAAVDIHQLQNRYAGPKSGAALDRLRVLAGMDIPPELLELVTIAIYDIGQVRSNF